MDWMPAVALAGLMIGLFTWLRADNLATRRELRAEIADLGNTLRGESAELGNALRSEISDLGNALRGESADLGKALRSESAEQSRSLRGEISMLAQEVGRLNERMARMEGLIAGLREAITGKQVA